MPPISLDNSETSEYAIQYRYNCACVFIIVIGMDQPAVTSSSTSSRTQSETVAPLPQADSVLVSCMHTAYCGRHLHCSY